MSLNPNQKAFCREYLKNGMNGTSAYMKVYKTKKEDSARKTASKLLTKVDIKEYINSIQEKIEEKEIVTVEEILNELKAIAFAKGSDYAQIKTRERVVNVVDDIEIKTECTDVDFIDTSELEEEKKKAIACIKKGRNGISVETYDKTKALELLGKYKGMWKDKEINIDIGKIVVELTDE